MVPYRDATTYRMMGRRRFSRVAVVLRRLPIVQRLIWRESFKILDEFRPSWQNNARFWLNLHEMWALLLKSKREEENSIQNKYRYC